MTDKEKGIQASQAPLGGHHDRPAGATNDEMNAAADADVKVVKDACARIEAFLRKELAAVPEGGGMPLSFLRSTLGVCIGHPIALVTMLDQK